MAPATAAIPDPGEPPVNTITREQWKVLLAKGVLPESETVTFTDLPAVTRRLVQEHRRRQAGSN